MQSMREPGRGGRFRNGNHAITAVAFLEIDIMPDIPIGSRNRDPRRAAVVRPVTRAPQWPAAPPRSPLLPWLIVGGAVVVFAGLLALVAGVVLVVAARSERQARDRYDDVSN